MVLGFNRMGPFAFSVERGRGMDLSSLGRPRAEPHSAPIIAGSVALYSQNGTRRKYFRNHHTQRVDNDLSEAISSTVPRRSGSHRHECGQNRRMAQCRQSRIRAHGYEAAWFGLGQGDQRCSLERTSPAPAPLKPAQQGRLVAKMPLQHPECRSRPYSFFPHLQLRTSQDKQHSGEVNDARQTRPRRSPATHPEAERDRGFEREADYDRTPFLLRHARVGRDGNRLPPRPGRQRHLHLD
jgi:hypothetical protein